MRELAPFLPRHGFGSGRVTLPMVRQGESKNNQLPDLWPPPGPSWWSTHCELGEMGIQVMQSVEISLLGHNWVEKEWRVGGGLERQIE